MSDKKATLYVPSSFVKTRTTPFGDVLQIDITDVKAFGEFVKANKKSDNRISFDLVPRKDPTKNSHNMQLNSWEPRKQEEQEAAPSEKPKAKKATPPKPADPSPESDLPF